MTKESEDAITPEVTAKRPSPADVATFNNRARAALASNPSVLTTTTTASDVFYQEDDGVAMEMSMDQMIVILSGLYGLLLVVLGLVIPVTEAMCSARSIPARRFELFYIYLYLISMLFIVYVYTYLLRNDGNDILASVSDRLARSLRKTSHNSLSADGGHDSASGDNSTTSLGKYRNTKIAFVSSSAKMTGSFYLRVGAVGFGVGSMIHSAITFGHFIEMTQSDHPCSDVIRALKPFTHMCFTFAQMYFVFMNSKMSINKNPGLARFGLMHMCGTNICVWLRSIVVETLRVMKVNAREQYLGSLGDGMSEGAANGTKVQDEYTRVLCVMWYNVGGATRIHKNASFDAAKALRMRSVDDDTDGDTGGFGGVGGSQTRTHRISVDCASSSQGLFLGLAVLVMALCCLIWFYVIIGNSDQNNMAGALLGHLSEDFIYVVTLIAIAMAAYQMKDMHFTVGFRSGIDEILTLVSLGGIGLFGVFSIVSSMFYLESLDGKLTVMTNVVMLVQAACQATFMLACLNVSAVDEAQASQKPGRNCVTFLLVSNFTLWVLNTFETQSPEHNVVQVKFFGANAWSIFSHISVPLGIYYRFHSTVCLSNIWKYAWKTSKGDNS